MIPKFKREERSWQKQKDLMNNSNRKSKYLLNLLDLINIFLYQYSINNQSILLEHMYGHIYFKIYIQKLPPACEFKFVVKTTLKSRYINIILYFFHVNIGLIALITCFFFVFFFF